MLGVQSATTNATYARRALRDTGVDIRLYDQAEQVNRDLLSGRLDVILADEIAMNELIERDEAEGFEIKGTAPHHEPTAKASASAFARRQRAEGQPQRGHRTGPAGWHLQFALRGVLRHRHLHRLNTLYQSRDPGCRTTTPRRRPHHVNASEAPIPPAYGEPLTWRSVGTWQGALRS